MRKLLIILLFIPLQLFGTDYYVRTDGNNANNGLSNTSGGAWLTLAYACSQVSAGTHTIHVAAGTYNETACTLAAGVSIEGAGVTTIITASSLTTEWTPIISAISGSVTAGNQSISNLKFDGNSVSAMAIWVGKRNSVLIHDCTFEDFVYIGVIFSGDGGNESTPPTNYTTGNKFYNNIVTNCSAYADDYGRGALYIGGQTGMEIYNNNISQTGRSAGTNGWPIKVWMYGGWSKGLKIYNNTLFKDDCTNWDFAIEGLWMYGTEIYGNTITGSIDINHIAKDTYEYGLYVHNNTLGPVANTALDYYGCRLEFGVSDVIIRYNLFRNLYAGISYTPRTETVTTQDISYNLFDNLTNNGWGIQMWEDTENQFALGTFALYNNVFYSNGSDKALYGVGFSGPSAGTLNIINNIFVNFTNYWGIFRYADNWDVANVKNNIYYGNGGSNLANWYSSEFPPSYTYTGNIIDNPDLDTDYSLLVGSPAIDAGLDVGLTTDYEGNTVPFNSIVDIGAFEYGSAAPATLTLLKHNGKYLRNPATGKIIKR